MNDEQLYQKYVELKSKLGLYDDNREKKDLKGNSMIDFNNPRPTGYCCFCKIGKMSDTGRFANFMQCLKCSGWDHEYCTGVKEDEDYICPVCDPTQHKYAPGFDLRVSHAENNKTATKTKKKKKKKKFRYGEDQEYNPLESPVRKRKLDFDEDMVIQPSPKKSKKSKQKKKTPTKKPNIIPTPVVGSGGGYDYSKYQKVEKMNKMINFYGDNSSSSGEEDIEMEEVATIQSNGGGELKQLFDEIVKMEIRYTEIKCDRKYKKAFEREREQARKFERQAADAKGNIKYAEEKAKKARKTADSFKRKMENLRNSHRREIDRIIGDKSSLSRENEELKEKMEDCYADRDRRVTEKHTYSTQIKILENDKRELQKKVKYYRSQLEKSSPGDEFDAVAVHGNAEVFSPNFKHQPEPEDPISLSTIFDPTKMPIMMKTEEETEEEEEEIFTSPPIKKTITTSLKGKPKVGKKKKTKRKNITIRGTITPVFVNGIDEFSVEDNEINDKEMCDICFQGTEEHGLLICEKCKFKAHEVCIEYRDWRTDPNMEKWLCNGCRQSNAS